MTKFRGHTTRWQFITTISLLLFTALFLGFNGAELVQGLATGSIRRFSRHPHEFIYAAVEPIRFGLNVGARVLGEVLFGAAFVLWWRRYREELRD